MNPLTSFDDFRSSRLRWHWYAFSENSSDQERAGFSKRVESAIRAEWIEWKESRDPLRRKMQELASQLQHVDDRPEF